MVEVCFSEMLLARYQITRHHSKDHNYYNMDSDSINVHIYAQKNDSVLGKCTKYTLKYVNIWTVLANHLPALFVGFVQGLIWTK
jgi:hypothetical protein